MINRPDMVSTWWMAEDDLQFIKVHSPEYHPTAMQS